MNETTESEKVISLFPEIEVVKSENKQYMDFSQSLLEDID